MGIGKRILNVLIGLLFIISVTVLGSSFLAKKVLVDAISQAGVDTAISHRMMDAVFGYAGADDTEWIAKIQNKIEKNGEVQAITQKVMNEITEDLSSGKAYKDVDVTKELNQILNDSMQEIKDTNPELNDDMLAMMKQQLKEELVDVQDVLNSYASNLYDNMNDTSTVRKSCKALYHIIVYAVPCGSGSSNPDSCGSDDSTGLSKIQRSLFTWCRRSDLRCYLCAGNRTYGK